MIITLPGVPYSTNDLYKSRYQNGKTYVYMTKEAADLKESYQWEAKAKWRRPVSTEEIRIEVTLFFPNNSRRRDWDNFHKIAMDALNGIVWADDSQIMEARVIKAIDSKRPRIEIKIF